MDDGLFFGTRLAEFAAGMVLGYLIHESAQGKFKIPKRLSFLQAQFCFIWLVLDCNCFIIRLFCPIFCFDRTNRNFYGAYKTIENSGLKPIERSSWIGSFSFGIYLIHQAPHAMGGKISFRYCWNCRHNGCDNCIHCCRCFSWKNLDRILHQAKSLFAIEPLISQKSICFLSL